MIDAYRIQDTISMNLPYIQFHPLEITNFTFPHEKLSSIVEELRSFVKEINSNESSECKVNDLLEEECCVMFIHIMNHRFINNNQSDNESLTSHSSYISNVNLVIRFYKKNENECIIELQKKSENTVKFIIFVRQLIEYIRHHLNLPNKQN
jgi:hypothetical protein